MQELQDFVMNHVTRGACQCGKCIDAPPNAKDVQPHGHTADMIFFKVRVEGNPNLDKLKELIIANKKGEFCELDLFDGKEHSYIEIGAWIGDQGLALMLMGLGSLVGLWSLLTPRTVLGNLIPDDMVQQMAGSGFVIVQAIKGKA